MSVAVKIEFELPVFLELEELAELAGTSVRALVETTTVRALDRRRRGVAVNARSTSHRLTTGDVAELRRLVAEGFTAKEIAARVGCHPNTVTAWKKQLASEETGA